MIPNLTTNSHFNYPNPQSKRVVPPNGPSNAVIAIIGEAPGADEIKMGRGFVGQAGRFMDNWLAKAGLDRSKVWITNVVKIRPPYNKIDRLSEYGCTPDEWVPSLLNELSTLPNLKVVIPMGALALKAVTGLEGIYKWRGSIIELAKPGTYAVPTLHPSHVMQRDYSQHLTCTNDIIKAKAVSKPGWVRTVRKSIIRPDLHTAINYIRLCKRSPMFSWDLETFDDQIACIGLALSPTDAMCIPFKRGYDNYWGLEDERLIWRELGEMFDGPAIKIAQNAFGFDHFYILKAYGSQPRAPHWDTKLMHALVMPELSHKLDYMTSIYTDIEYYKDDTKDETTGKRFDRTRADQSYFERLYYYNCKDVQATFEIALKLNEELKQLNMQDFYQGFTAPLYRALFGMSQVGVNIDQNIMLKLRTQKLRRIQRYEKFILNHLGYVPNPKSSPQMIKFLYTDLALPKQYRFDKATKSQKVTANAEAIEKLIEDLLLTGKITDNKTCRILRAFMGIREHSKLVSTYLNPLKLDSDGRLRTSYGVTETGRLSSSGKLDGTGMNLQNIPKGNPLKAMFIDDHGRELSEDDLSQAEARVVALLAKCQPMLDEFKSKDGDVFKLIASMLYCKPKDQITSEERSKCKRLVHSVHYGAGDDMNAKMMGLTLAETQQLKSSYFSVFGELRKWQEDTRKKVVDTRRLTTPYGRTRIFTGRLPLSQSYGHDTYKEALAQNPQSTVGDHTNQGLLKLYHKWRGTSRRLLYQVHDALIKSYPIDQRLSVIDDVKWAFSKPIHYEGQYLNIPFETSVGQNWYDMNKVNI